MDWFKAFQVQGFVAMVGLVGFHWLGESRSLDWSKRVVLVFLILEPLTAGQGFVNIDSAICIFRWWPVEWRMCWEFLWIKDYPRVLYTCPYVVMNQGRVPLFRSNDELGMGFMSNHSNHEQTNACSRNVYMRSRTQLLITGLKQS